MKLFKLFLPACIIALMPACIHPSNDIDTPDTDSIPVQEEHIPQLATGLKMEQIDSLGWWWSTKASIFAPETGGIEDAPCVISGEDVHLHFYGWSIEEDSIFYIDFPDSVNSYGRCTMQYQMKGWNNGPSEWDMTTQVMIWDNQNNQWLEITRAITPYGGAFAKNWTKNHYLDVSEFLPLLRGHAKFKVFYCGWDATESRAHAMQMSFGFYNDSKYPGTQTCRQKIYDSTEDPDAFGHNGYRAWSYGVIGCSIEDTARLGYRKIHIPAGTKRAILRVCFTGHGQDAYYGCGTFPNRPGYRTMNCAEFDYNEYQIVLCGDTIAQKGVIWETNDDNYKQAGTYQYDRAGWGPGKMCNVQHWEITGLTGEACYITLDMNLDEYIGTTDDPRHDQVPCYYVEADLFGYTE